MLIDIQQSPVFKLTYAGFVKEIDNTWLSGLSQSRVFNLRFI